VAVFVLGAGATRGASFVGLGQDPCLPPLDADFFVQLQRIESDKHADAASQNVHRAGARVRVRIHDGELLESRGRDAGPEEGH
jgi:hypothetical protein